MGSDLSKSIGQPRLYTERSINPQNRLYANYPEPHDTWFRKTMHFMKHDRAEPLYFGYCGLQGAIIGMVVGVGLLNPLMRHSPFAYRKLTMSFRPNEQLVPLTAAANLTKSFLLRYGVHGFTAGVLLKFFSDFYDFTLSTNRLTKYLTLGTFSGAFFGYFYGGFRLHWHGAGIGLLAGLIGAAGIPSGVLKMRGEIPPAAEYLSSVTDDEKRRFSLQENRLMGYSKPQN